MIYNFLTRKTSAIHDMFEDIVFSYLESKVFSQIIISTGLN